MFGMRFSLSQQAQRVGLAATCLLLWSSAAFGQALPPTVFVEAGEVGQGMLRGRGKECFVITPNHVVDATLKTISITGDRGTRATASVVRSVQGDIAILRVTDGASLSCPPWSFDGNVASRLRGVAAGHIEIRDAVGAKTLLPVTLSSVDADRIEVRTPPSSGDVEQGMSGASLIVNGGLVGMLLETKSGSGVVSPIDNVMRLTDFFFAPGATAGAARLGSLLEFGQSVGELAVFGLAKTANRILEIEVKSQAKALGLKPHVTVDSGVQNHYQDQFETREDVYAFAIGALVRIVPVLKARLATTTSAADRKTGAAGLKSAREKVETYLGHLGLTASRNAYPAFASSDYETLAAEARDYAAAIRAELESRQ